MDPSLVLSGQPGAWRARWSGVLKCGHIWTCPVCSSKLRAERWEKAQRGCSSLLGRWQMVTLTIRHHAGMPLRGLLIGLLKAWARTKRGGRMQRLWTEKVSASLRALEVTHGEHGWHPHLHVFLRTDEWSEEETDALFERWQMMVLRELGSACVPDRGPGLVWSTAVDFDAVSEPDRLAYLFKLGQELTGSSKVAGRGRDVASRTPWELAHDAVEGDERSVALWSEFRAATKGKRMIELDDRLARAAKKTELAILGVEYQCEPLVPEQTLTIPLSTVELCALRQYERWHDDRIVGRIMDDLRTSADPRVTANAWLDIVCRKLRLSRAPPVEYDDTG